MNSQNVSDLEFTTGNYDSNGKLIENKVPTLTTDLCEIGSFNDTCYFTFILDSNSFSQELLDRIKVYDKMHIYGFKDFLTDLYPKRCFSYKKFEGEIRKDAYVQVQFNFEKTKPKTLLENYLNLKQEFINNNVIVINQITHQFA